MEGMSGVSHHGGVSAPEPDSAAQDVKKEAASGSLKSALQVQEDSVSRLLDSLA